MSDLSFVLVGWVVNLFNPISAPGVSELQPSKDGYLQREDAGIYSSITVICHDKKYTFVGLDIETVLRVINAKINCRTDTIGEHCRRLT